MSRGASSEEAGYRSVTISRRGVTFPALAPDSTVRRPRACVPKEYSGTVAGGAARSAGLTKLRLLPKGEEGALWNALREPFLKGKLAAEDAAGSVAGEL